MNLLRKNLLPIGVIALLVFIIGFFVFFKTPLLKPAQALDIQGIYFTQAARLSPFELSQGDGTLFTDEDLQGQYTLLFFGFTYCPDICPVTLSVLDTVVKDFQKQYPQWDPPKVVFVSVDPERDQGPHLKQYVEHFNSDFIGVTGAPTELNRLTKPMGVVFDKVVPNPDAPQEYLVEHSTALMLINPKGQWVAVLTPPFQSEMLLNELVKIYNNERRS